MNAILYYESSYVLVVGPQSFLRLNLPFKGSCQPYHQQLTQSYSYCNTTHSVKIVLYQGLYRGNAASGVYEFKGLSLRLALDIEAAHEVDERAVVAVAAGVGHAAPLHAGVVLLVLRAVEVLVLAPVQVALAADAAALEVLLDQVDDVLEVEVVSVALYQLVRQLVLEELSQLVGVDEPQGDDGHLRQEEYQQTQRVESQ